MNSWLLRPSNLRTEDPISLRFYVLLHFLSTNLRKWVQNEAYRLPRRLPKYATLRAISKRGFPIKDVCPLGGSLSDDCPQKQCQQPGL